MGLFSWIFRRPKPISEPAPYPSWPCTVYTCPSCDEPLVDSRTRTPSGVQVSLACPTGEWHAEYLEADDPLAASFRPYTDAEIHALTQALGELLSERAVAQYRCPIDRAPLAAVKHGSTWKVHCIRCGNDATLSVPL